MLLLRKPELLILLIMSCVWIGVFLYLAFDRSLTETNFHQFFIKNREMYRDLDRKLWKSLTDKKMKAYHKELLFERLRLMSPQDAFLEKLELEKALSDNTDRGVKKADFKSKSRPVLKRKVKPLKLKTIKKVRKKKKKPLKIAKPHGVKHKFIYPTRPVKRLPFTTGTKKVTAVPTTTSDSSRYAVTIKTRPNNVLYDTLSDRTEVNLHVNQLVETTESSSHAGQIRKHGQAGTIATTMKSLEYKQEDLQPENILLSSKAAVLVAGSDGDKSAVDTISESPYLLYNSQNEILEDGHFSRESTQSIKDKNKLLNSTVSSEQLNQPRATQKSLKAKSPSQLSQTQDMGYARDLQGKGRSKTFSRSSKPLKGIDKSISIARRTKAGSMAKPTETIMKVTIETLNSSDHKLQLISTSALTAAKAVKAATSPNSQTDKHVLKSTNQNAARVSSDTESKEGVQTDDIKTTMDRFLITTDISMDTGNMYDDVKEDTTTTKFNNIFNETSETLPPVENNRENDHSVQVNGNRSYDSHTGSNGHSSLKRTTSTNSFSKQVNSLMSTKHTVNYEKVDDDIAIVRKSTYTKNLKK